MSDPLPELSEGQIRSIAWTSGYDIHDKAAVSTFNKFARAIIAADRAGLASAPSASWQPIETAPQDGSEVLVFKPSVGILVARWLDEDHPDLDGCIGFHEAWNHASIERATLWMPLPAAPKAKGEAP